jgi:hypothetical protein
MVFLLSYLNFSDEDWKRVFSKSPKRTLIIECSSVSRLSLDLNPKYKSVSPLWSRKMNPIEGPSTWKELDSSCVIVTEKVASGAFGIVYKAKFFETEVALKVCKDPEDSLENEIELIRY